MAPPPWFRRALRASLGPALDALTRPPAPPRAESPADDSPVVPPDSPALAMVLRQAELEARHAGAHLAGAFATGDYLFALGGSERARRQMLAAKVRRGAPVTQRELIAATTGFSNVMGTAGDAARVALAVGTAAGGPGSSSAPPPSVAPGPAPAPPTHDPAALARDLEWWLRERPATLLANLRAQRRTADRFDRGAFAYEVVAICWARTMLGEGRLRRDELPAAFDQWLATDRLARQPGSPAPADLRDRAWHVDLVTAAVARAAPHAGVA